MAQIFDPVKTFKGLTNAITGGVANVFPIETETRILRATNIRVDDSNASPDDYKLQKRLKLEEKDFVAPVYGDLELVDKATGQVIDTKKNFRLMDVPALTSRFSYILGGNEYTVDKQLRMKPGIYTREKENGELESQFNLAKGGGRGFKMWINPEDGIFKLKIGTANPPLYPLLKTLGVEDSKIKEAWGDAMHTLNQNKTRKSGDSDIMKAYKSIFRKDASSFAQAQVELRDFFDKTVLSEETTKRTLGKGFSKVEPETLLLTSRRLLSVSRGEEEPDDRDSLVFKHIYDTPDLVGARIEANHRKVQNDVKRVMDKKNKITEIVSKDMLNKPVRQFFVQGSVAHAAEQTNPTTMLSEATKVTSLGEGAIGDMNAITDSMRAVNTSHAGVLDPVATPECLAIGTEIYTRSGWVCASEITMDSDILCRPEGCTPLNTGVSEFRKPDRVIAAPYKGKMYGMDNGLAGYLVTPNHRVMCKPYEYRGNVHYRISNAEDMHGQTRMFPIVHEAVEGSLTHFKLSDDYNIPIDDWAEFMGWFLSEGSASINAEKKGTVVISQTKSANPEKCAQISGLLSRLPFGRWAQSSVDFRQTNHILNSYLVQFGYCNDKFIPEYFFDAPVSAKQKLVEALLLGDGRTYSNRKVHSYKQQVFTTTSKKLAVGFERLAVDLGYPVSIKVYPDNRQERYLDVYEVRIMQRKGCVAHQKKGNYFVQDYDGMVYCVTVPGGLILTRRPGKVGIWTGNSDRIGINLHLALGSTIKDKELQTLVRNVNTGKIDFMDIRETFDKKVAFPDQYKDGKPVKDTVTVMHSGKITEVKPEDVELSLQSPKQMFTYLTNLVPFSANVQGNRAFMANKMLAQAIPLKYREAPWVQTKMPTGNSFENFVGKVFSTSAEMDGTVKKITYDDIEIEDSKGATKKYPLYNNFPLNNKNFVHSTPLVKEGDKVILGQSLADTNYTKDGTLAIGTNLRVGILPYKDSTFEDGYVISESASKKLTSEHLREVSIQVGREDLLDVKAFKAHYPTAMSSDMSNKLDPDGVIKRGTIVEPGDIIIAHLQKTEASEEDARLGKLSKKLVKGYRNNAQIWDKGYLGTVTDVHKSPDAIKVFIRTDETMQIGDKIVNRYGAKGIVSAIVPDNEMPVNKEGTRIDVAISPSAIPGRINPSQVLETAISKVAKKWGRPIKIDNFAGINAVKRVRELLDEEGLTDKEELIDPKNGQSLGKVMVGDQYYLKLMHQVAKKINARGAGPGYDIDMQPTKGGQSSARAMDRLTWNALVAHGARENMYEMTAYKAEKNPELWRNIQLGLPIPAPKTPFVFNKLLGYLAAGGVNVKKDGNKLYMLPLTDEEVLSRSNGEIDDAKVVISKNLRPVQDGLFDEVKTGGLKGTKWTHVKLAEPLLNPVMENAAITLLDMTQKQLDDVLAGNMYWDHTSKKLTTENTGVTSGTALEKMLGNIDVDKEFTSIKAKAPSLKGQGLDKANKKMRFLRALKVQGTSPDKAYMIHNVPILPPQFRPMYPLPNGSLNTAPINYLYRDMIMVNKQLKELEALDDSVKSDLRRDLYRSVKAVQGLGDPLVQRGEKKIIGAIETIKGNQPKEGYFQSVVFSKNQDLSGSSTITPSTDMNPDEILLPRDMAWSMFQPFIVKEMTKMGYKPLDAMVMVRDHDQRANLALEKVTKERPVWLNRAPSLHKFSMMAFQPKLYDGKSIGIHPLVVGGFNADIDGNCADFDSLIKLRITKAALDIISSNLYTQDNIEYKEFFMRTVAESTASWKQGDTITVNTKIGEFPRIGLPTKDKNGADVYRVPEGVEVVGCDPVTGEAKYYPVTMFTAEQGCKTVEIFFGQRSIILSDNESMAAFDHTTGALSKIAPKDVAKRMIPVLKKDPTPYGTFGNRDIGWMLGAYISDGWTSANTIGYAKLEDAKRAEFIRIMRSLHDNFTAKEYSGVPENGKLGNSIKVHLNSHTLVEYMKMFNCIHDTETSVRTSNKKMIPQWVLHEGSEDMLWGLMSGLIDGDGSMSINMSTGRPRFTAKFCTSSPYLRDSVLALCYRLGVRADVTTVPPRGFSSEAYIVNMSTVDLFNYLDKMSCIGERESDIITKWKECPPAKDDRDMIPMSVDEVATLKLFISSKVDASFHAVVSKNKSIGFRVGRKILERHMEILDRELPALATRVKATNTVWETVSSIVDAGVREVFDLAVEDSKVYAINNGIVIWDTMGVYVPVSHKAVEEARQFMPTKVLEHAGDGRIMVSPGHDIMTGMYYLTRDGKDRTDKYKFDTIDDAMKIYKSKTIEIFDDVMIGGRKTSIGKDLVYKALPEGMLIPPGGLNKSTIKAFLKELSLKGSPIFNSTMDKLSKLSAQFNIYSSISIGLEDLEPDYKARDAFLKGVKVRMDGAKDDNEKRKIIQSELPKFHTTVSDYMKRHPESALSVLLTANGKPSFDQFKQLISTPFAVSDTDGRAIPIITTKSFAEGLPVSEYWTTTYGSRTGMIQKRLETAEPGYYSKQILSVTIDNVVSSEDCGTKNGVMTNISKKNDVLGRYVAGTNELIDENTYTMKLKQGVTSLKLRSALTCEVKEGTCAMCYGLRENGQKAKIGDNVGALAGQFFTEPTTQGSMKAFHCLEKGMLLWIRTSEGSRVTTFENLWTETSSPVSVEDDMEYKDVVGLEVWDNDKFTKVFRITRHRRHADSPMIFVRSRTNRFLISQDNHPHMLSTNGGDPEEVCLTPDMYEKHKYNCTYSFPIWSDTKVSPFYDPYYIGLYVTDGSLCYHEKEGVKTFYGVALYQNKDSLIYGDCVKAMEALPYEGEIHMRERVNKGGKIGAVMTKYGRELGDLFNAQCGNSNRNKHLPFDFVGYSDEDLSSALCGIIDGDGCVIPIEGVKEHRTCAVIEMSSIPLMQQLSLICDKLGLTYRVSACAIRALTRCQTYRIVIYPKKGDDAVFTRSRKMSLKGTFVGELNRTFTDKVDMVKQIFFNDSEEYVYDLTTETHTLSVNGFWTHNSGAVLGAGAATSGGLERLQQLTMVPDYLKDKATLAKKAGSVNRIEDNPAGGKNLYIDGEKHLIGVRNVLKVKVGDQVSRGDELTDGPIKPQELMELKGIEATQKYLVDSMQETFKGMGTDLSRKLIETVVRSTTNLTTVVDSGNHPYYVPGDQVPLNEVRSWNLHRQNEMDVEEAIGGTLAVAAGPYSAGAVMTKDVSKALKNLGVKNVIVSSDPVKHSPSIIGVNLLARMGKDWLAKLNTNYIEQGIIKGVQTGDVADTESYNPTGPYVLATGFGKGEKGKY